MKPSNRVDTAIISHALASQHPQAAADAAAAAAAAGSVLSHCAAGSALAHCVYAVPKRVNTTHVSY